MMIEAAGRKRPAHASATPAAITYGQQQASTCFTMLSQSVPLVFEYEKGASVQLFNICMGCFTADMSASDIFPKGDLPSL